MNKTPENDHDDPKRPTVDATASEAPTEPTMEIPAHDRSMQELRQEKDRIEATLQRSLADLSNLRKRHQKELEDSRKRVLEGSCPGADPGRRQLPPRARGP